MPYKNPVDVANRALQHLGAERINYTDGFTENSKNAAAMSFAYDMLRRVLLRENLWKFSTRRVVLRPLGTTTMIIAPALWDATQTYRVGQIVTDSSNQLWVSIYPANLNNSPGASFFWAPYCGPLTCEPWDEDTAYHSGEIVYTYDGDGTYRVFKSLVDSNEDDPETGTAWDDETTYMKDQVVSLSGTDYISLIDLNLNNTPSATPAAWASGTTYASGNSVYGTDGYVYTSAQSANTGHDPTTDDGTWWTNTNVLHPWVVYTGDTRATNWIELTPIALTDFFMEWPIGTGPSTQTGSKNVYRLPSGFLRYPPQDPKAGAVSYLGGPSGAPYKDWLFEGDFIITTDTGPLVLRFIADIQDVTAMDDLFCEALAARLAYDCCEEVTQSITKQAAIGKKYADVVQQAKTANAIETGPVEPEEDDFVLCRA